MKMYPTLKNIGESYRDQDIRYNPSSPPFKFIGLTDTFGSKLARIDHFSFSFQFLVVQFKIKLLYFKTLLFIREEKG